MQTYVQVTQVKNDAEWLAEMHEYGYEGMVEDMYVAVGDFDYTFADDLQIVSTQSAEYAFMCGNANDRRCFDFAVDVYTCKDGKCWITEEQFEAIG